MYHFVYCTENLVNGKIYIGKHSTNKIDDGYLGSSVLLRRAIKKYGIENFKRTIIQQFDSENEAYMFERELVNEQFVTREDTYNIQLGGLRWDSDSIKSLLTSSKFDKEAQRQRRTQRLQDPATRQKISEGVKRHYAVMKERGIKIGRKHSEEFKTRIGKIASIAQSGNGNSRYGSVWVCTENEERSIPGDNLDEYMKNGWQRGRCHIDRFKLKNSPNKGKRWIWNPQTLKRKLVTPDTLEAFILDGWKLNNP